MTQFARSFLILRVVVLVGRPLVESVTAVAATTVPATERATQPTHFCALRVTVL